MILLKHVTYQTIREFNMCSREHVELGKCKDQEWIPEEYADALEGEIRSMCLADDYADSTGCADRDGLNDVVGFNTFSPNTSSRNASSPLSDSSGTIEDGDAMRDLTPIPCYYTSQDSYSLSLSPIATAIEPNLNTPVNHYDTEFSMATPTLLTNIRTMNEDAITMDNIISPSSWNDIQWDAFVGTETSNPTQDIDTFLRNATSLNAQRSVQVPDTTQLKDNSLDGSAEGEIINFGSFFQDETAYVVGASSAVPEQYNVPGSNANTIGSWFSVG